jgi:hypothetical protein
MSITCKKVSKQIERQKDQEVETKETLEGRKIEGCNKEETVCSVIIVNVPGL